jgi:hypothetical protein
VAAEKTTCETVSFNNEALISIEDLEFKGGKVGKSVEGIVEKSEHMRTIDGKLASRGRRLTNTSTTSTPRERK